MEMKHISLFSGIGGFDLAAEWMGWGNIAHCEWNEFVRKVLKYYWPNSISYEDITKTDFSIHRGQIDIVTGGFPCQPYSQAGKRLGKEDDRHLWPQMLRAIREIQPTWVVGENVSGLTNWNGGMVFDEVQADLESEGYEVTPFLLPACSVNAPHRRDRIWFVAHSNSCRNNRTKGSKEGIWQYENKEQQRSRVAMQINGLSNERIITDAKSKQSEWEQSKQRKFSQQGKRKLRRSDRKDITSNTNSGRQPCEEYREAESRFFAEKSFSDYWQNFPTQSPVCNGDDGIPSELDGITFPKWRNESIKAGGNAIVPQVAYQIFKAIEQYNHGNNPPTRSE